jgi:hypothetical protein
MSWREREASQGSFGEGFESGGGRPRDGGDHTHESRRICRRERFRRARFKESAKLMSSRFRILPHFLGLRDSSIIFYFDEKFILI